MDNENDASEAGPSRPSANELRLGRRVLELEKERDELSAQVGVLKRFAASTTIPVPENLDLNHGPITIPNDLIPTLSLLRKHINDLTRDNEALRYTFLGTPLTRPPAQPQRGAPAQSPSGHTHGNATDVSMTPTPTAANLPPVDIPEAGPSRRIETEGIDLDEVAKRVKELVLENEELGEMVLEAGRSAESEWQVLIDDAKRVIESLESDLEHHASVVETQKAEIERNKLELESLRSAQPGKPRHSGASSHSRDMHESTSSASRSHRSHTAESRQSGRSKDDRRPSSRHGNEGRSDSDPNRHKEKERQRDREKNHRDSERNRDSRQSESKGKVKDVDMALDDSARSATAEVASPPAQGGPPRAIGLSIKGSHQRQSGDRQDPAPPRTDVNGEGRVDDRSWKRRK